MAWDKLGDAIGEFNVSARDRRQLFAAADADKAAHDAARGPTQRDVIEALMRATDRGNRELTLWIVPLTRRVSVRVRYSSVDGGRKTVVDCEPDELVAKLDALWPAPPAPPKPEEKPAVRYGPHKWESMDYGQVVQCRACGQRTMPGLYTDWPCVQNPLPEPPAPDPLASSVMIAGAFGRRESWFEALCVPTVLYAAAGREER